jgi:hypothetical protein
MSPEQRQSYRIRVPGHLEHAVLRVAGRTVRVRLIDESAGGFAIALSESLRTSPGAILRLRTAAGWHEVRVIHSVPCEDGAIVGLVRLQDLEDPRYAQHPHARGAFGSLACVGLGIVLMIFVVNSLAQYRAAPSPAAGASSNGVAVSDSSQRLAPELAK